MIKKKIDVGSDFSGVGAFDYAIKRIFKDVNTVFACDMDKFARESYIHNHGEPGYYPFDVYEREIPKKSLDIYMTSPPCQSFSLAGKRKGKNDLRGVLFFNSHEFIQKNKPRFFIFENVKGLLSDNGGQTFNEWITLLGGKSVNGTGVIFPHENSVPYHIYHTVLNSKKHGVPQNRERVFIVGIRDDFDNVFTWPKEEHLTKKLKDILENEVDDKYFLSDKALKYLMSDSKSMSANTLQENEYTRTLMASDYKSPLTVKIKSNTKKGYENATENDSINFSNPNSETRRGLVGKEVAQTLDTGCNQGICIPVLTPDRPNKRQNGCRFKENNDPSFTLTAQDKHGIYDGYKIRRLTPRECFRLQDFPDTHELVCSDSQSYKQAGNSIRVRVLELIIRKLKF